MTLAVAVATALRFASWLAFLSSTAWLAFLLVCRGLRALQASARWLAAACVSLLIQHALLLLVDLLGVAGLHVFRPWFALPLALLSATLGHARLGGGPALDALRADLRCAAAAIRAVWGPWVHRLMIVWGLAAAAVRALAGLVSPPLTWDTLTYHALKPAEWVQLGFRARTLAPDQWGYLTFYPDAAEEPGAWSMLFLKSDLGLPLVGIAQWVACGFAVYALARALAASREQAFRAGLFVAFLPALLGEMVSGYADMFVLLVFVALSFALVLAFRRGGRAEAMLVGGAAGLLAGAKLSGLPIALVALGAAALAPAGPGRAARLRSVLWTAAAALLAGGPHYFRVWAETGSPLYPYAVKIGRWSLGEGNAELRALFAGRLLAGDPRAMTGAALVQSLVLPSWSPASCFMGFGPGVLVLVPLACAGLARQLAAAPGRPARQRFVLPLALTAMALVPIAGIMSRDLAGQRALWLPNLGRLLLPLPAMLAVLGATVSNRVAAAYLAMAALVTLTLAWPGGVGAPMWAAIGALVPWMGGLAALWLLFFVGFARIPALAAARSWGLPACATAAAVAFAGPLAKVRREHRYAIDQAAAASPPAFIMHPSRRRYASAWPLWRAVDDGAPHRIAASYGWNGVGDNWFRYPLLGSHLQNRVLYVPITGGAGDVIDYRCAACVRAEADESAWLARLRSSGVDLVFLGDPEPPEQAFVLRHPESFQLVARGQDGRHALYRLVPGRP
jgi:hypothetical protein